MTGEMGQTAPGSWIALEPRDGERSPMLPVGFEAYVEITHEAQLDKPPDPLPQDKLRTLLTLLAPGTSTPDQCFFGQWTVWGHRRRPTRIWTFHGDAAHAHVPEPLAKLQDLHPLDQVLQLGVDMRYDLFSGPLAAGGLVGDWWSEHIFEPHTPDLIWPLDRAWCVLRDGDSDTIVAGSSTLIRNVVAQPDLDVRLI